MILDATLKENEVIAKTNLFLNNCKQDNIVPLT